MIRQEWLQPAADGPACGPNLEYDQEYLALEEAGRGRPEQQYGETVIPEQEPDWIEVVKRATALLDRTRDLRVVQLLTRGLTRTQGLPGLRDGLVLTRNLLDTFWEPLHPQLDFEGEPDPVLRANALSTFADPQGLLRDVRYAVCLRSPLGAFTVRDVEKILAPNGAGEGPVTVEQLRAVMRDAIVADGATLTEASEAIAALDGIRSIVANHLEPEAAPDLTPLRKTVAIVGDLAGTIRSELTSDAAAAPAGSAEGGPTAIAAAVGEIRSREDAIRALERVCDFLARSEPTNPAPLFIRRAQRLMTMPFLDIIRELAPDAAGQVENMTGSKT